MKPKKKRVAIIGLGQFGSSLALALAPTCEVLVIDSDQSIINEIADYVEMALRMDARDFSNLSAVLNSEFDEAVVCIGGSFEASVLAVLHLKKLGIPSIHAKALNEDHGKILHAVGATNVIYPEKESAHRLSRQINNPNLLDFVELSDDTSVMEIAPPDGFCGKTLLELDLRRKFNVYVIAIKEIIPGRTVVIPGPDFVVKDSDSLVVVGEVSALQKLQNLE
ncbi:MAG: TrkA family potassium uptake protein [Deltaproteobacteria bacterium HGW-Deltaproteobacteria-22]|nr:MAG: TrkA family potassium uptake protein [Deltaproteobacteria bacterium HGW-Deltaproteobacteria-22]